eukprot:g48660.t1
MTSLPYVHMNDEPVQPWRRLKAATALAGVALMSSAGWLSRHTSNLVHSASSFSFSSSSQSTLSFRPVPKEGMEHVLIKPGPASLLAMKLPSGSPSSLFIYSNQIPYQLLKSASSADGWVYGARLLSPEHYGEASIATPTGQSEDVVKGRLLTWPNGASFHEALDAADKAYGYDPSHPNKRRVQRGQLLVVQQDGSSTPAYWYYEEHGTGTLVAMERIAVIGSGNWGSTAARIVGQNALRHTQFHDDVVMWVNSETITHHGRERNLVDVINEENENVKYCPGYKLGPNVRAEGDLLKAVEGATMLIFVFPHQFIEEVVNKLRGHIDPHARAISLIKGTNVDQHGFQLMSLVIKKELGLDCSVLMGANVANEIAQEKFTEATVGYRNPASGRLWQQAFNTPYFRVRTINDPEGCEISGTLKNIVALGAGFVDGLDMGSNTKASIIRIGLLEMMALAKMYFPSVKTETFFESAGVADLITTCYGGRNRKVAEAFVRAGGKKSFEQLEAELLNGQKLQGFLSSQEVQAVLRRQNLESKFPLFTTINQIANGERPPSDIVNFEKALDL